MSNFWGPIPSLRLFQPHHRRAIDSFLREKENVPFNHPFIGLSRDCDFHCKGDLSPCYSFPYRGLLGTPRSDENNLTHLLHIWTHSHLLALLPTPIFSAFGLSTTQFLHRHREWSM